jgi:hypothetical protein
MAPSVKPGTLSHHHHRHHRHPTGVPPKAPVPAVTPGVKGRADAADPTLTTLLGYTTTALTGVRDWADHTLHEIEDWALQALGSVGVDRHTKAPMAVGPRPAGLGDALDLGFLGEYVGGEVSPDDIKAAAADLQCDASLIYAIAKQESASSSFIQVDGRTVPSILYERHIFRRYTSPHLKPPSPYEHDHPDICGPAYHVTHKGHGKDKGQVIDNVTKKVAQADDIYGPSGRHQYERLCKAYALDRGAALEACSWGKFQLMGFNYKAAGYADVFAFVKAMSSGDPAHIKAFLKFAKSNRTLLSGLQNRNYEQIAEGHNGTDWRRVNPNYASNLEKYSKEWK